jgi:hypothetical protein
MRNTALTLTLLLVACSAVASAQRPGLEEIRRLAGCFEVSFRFVDEADSRALSGEATVAREWIGFQRSGEDRVLLQHLLVAGTQPFPHWHETWIWHADDQAWTQEVRGGAPGPGSELRYSCTAPWTANRWECHAGRSSKPLRDADHEYDWLDRRNILLVTPGGWVHNQQNGKMRAAGELVAYELGWNMYRRIEDQACGAAVERFPIQARE